MALVPKPPTPESAASGVTVPARITSPSRKRISLTGPSPTSARLQPRLSRSSVAPATSSAMHPRSRTAARSQSGSDRPAAGRSDPDWLLAAVLDLGCIADDVAGATLDRDSL